MKRNSKTKSEHGPKAAVIDGCVKALERMMATIGEGQKPMTSKERRRTLKLKKGGRDLGRTLAQLASKHGIDGLAPTSEMLDDIAYVERLAPLATQAANLSALLADLLLQADGRAWTVACTTYALLQGLAARDTRVAQDLAPVVASLSTRDVRRRNAALKATAAAPPVTTSDAPPAKGA